MQRPVPIGCRAVHFWIRVGRRCPPRSRSRVQNASLRDRCQFAMARQFTIANSNHPNHTAQTRAIHAYLRWRNANARHPDVLAAQRRERARIRSEKGIRWGGRSQAAAA